MTGEDKKLPASGVSAEVDAFIRKVAAMPAARPAGERGRLVFAMDATASREPTWDRACRLQGEMFEATEALGGLEIQLVYYRGFNECKASRFYAAAADLHRAMSSVSCVGGQTQIERVIDHAIAATKARRVHALVFVGDAIEEPIDDICHRAGELGLLGVPAFLFQEGGDPTVERGFRQLARLTKGAYCRFDSSSAGQLRDLLAAVAVYAAGGRRALEALGQRKGGITLQLTSQLGKS